MDVELDTVDHVDSGARSEPALQPPPAGADDAADAGDGRSDRRTTALTWLLAAAMAAAACLLAAPGILADPEAAVPGPAWLLLLPLFALAEVVVIHLPTQRNAHGHTLRELPAVLGLIFLAPQQYVTAYVVGAVLALVLAARMRGLKLAFNTAMFALEAALGVLTYHAILQGGDPLSLTGWAAAVAAVVVTDLLSVAAITAAITLTEGAFDREVLHETLVSGSYAALVNTCVALLVATLAIVQPTSLPLFGIVVVLLAVAYRVYLSLARGHAQTRLLYRFVDRTSSATSSEDVMAVVLTEAAALMHAERAWLVQVAGPGEVRCLAVRDGLLHSEVLPDPGAAVTDWWWPALEGPAVRHQRPRPRRGEEPPAEVTVTPMSAPRDGLAARLGGAGGVQHLLVVCDRSFEKETFSAEDEQVFEALAAHAGVALERARSVSDLEALAAKLEVARDAALAASEAKSLFLANMSHEIRTPLTTVLATAEMLEDTDLDDLQRSLLERMLRSGGSLRELVEAILDFSRIETGQVELAATRFDLHALVADVAGVYRLRSETTGNRFGCDLAPGTPREVRGDRGRLRQVLVNLLDNAFKFTHDGDVCLAVRPSTVPGHVDLVVRDTGIGIPRDEQARIFDVFSQVDPSTTRRYEGTGLGLAICHRLTHLMEGTLVVDSDEDRGSTFTLRLPLGS